MAPPEPIPLAPNRTALNNRLSLLFSSQSPMLKNMNTSRPARPPRQTRRQEEEGEEEERLYDETEGLGYVRPSGANKDKTRQADVALRARLLGKRKGDPSAGGARKTEESSEDEDEGRGSLGKRKRPKKMREEGDSEEKAPVPDEGPVADKTAPGGEGDATTTVNGGRDNPGSAPPAKKKKKKNKKKK